jgi:hypothetical protein
MSAPKSDTAPQNRPNLTKKRSFSFRRTWSNQSNCSSCSEGGDFASSHPSLPQVIHALSAIQPILETSPIKPPDASAGVLGGLLIATDSSSTTNANKPNICILNRDQTVAGEKLGQGSFCIVQDVMFLHMEEDVDEDEEKVASSTADQVPKLVDVDDACCKPKAPGGLRGSTTTLFTLSAHSDESNLSVLPSPYLPGEVVTDQSPTILSSGDHSTSVARYCIKHLRSDIDGAQTLRGQRDLLVECSVLKSLHHPHVIAAVGMSRTIQHLLEEYSDRGVTHVPTHNLERHTVDDFFLIEERLAGTLRPRLKQWKRGILESGRPLPHLDLPPDDLVQSQNGLSLPPIPNATASGVIRQAPRSTGMLSSFLRRRVSKQKKSSASASQSNDVDFWIERLGVMRNIASALSYLHKHAMVYRDLKPDNIGFTRDGTLKIFDFGMAKELHPEDQCHINRFDSEGMVKIKNTNTNGDEVLYRLTGCTGSPRYMAPEVASNDPYNRKADTYSFAVLLWQICALTIPFKGYSFSEHYEMIAVERKRPTLSYTNSWPTGLSQLIYQCWSHDIAKRPCFNQICQELQHIQGAHMESQ